MSKTSQAIENVIEDCKIILNLARGGEPAHETVVEVERYAAKDTRVYDHAEICRLVEKQKGKLEHLQSYIQHCGAKENKITKNWQSST
jgi:hypothetical protein